MARNKRNDKLREERIGMIKINTHGSKMTVINYIDNQNVVVTFENGFTTTTRWGEFKEGKVKSPYDKSVYGVGYIGEGEYKATINGVKYPAYQVWHSMMTRCYQKSFHENNPAYADKTVCDEWHNFQSFAKWYDDNLYDFNGILQLDKDILTKGSKMYSPETCVFVPQRINNLFTKSTSSRGLLPIGVTFRKDSARDPYQARAYGKNKDVIHLGYHKTPEESFQAYKVYKENLIKEIAEDYKEIIPKRLYDTLVKYEVEIDD